MEPHLAGLGRLHEIGVAVTVAVDHDDLLDANRPKRRVVARADRGQFIRQAVAGGHGCLSGVQVVRGVVQVIQRKP
ncbi:MAG: hypothetical protein EBR52_09190, partial [Microbacteriaceae bacterium]|nr:hypothetical protein [Microbacteriaceae bacterium]